MIKSIVVGFAVAVFALLAGYLTFALLGLGDVESGGDAGEVFGLKRLGEADSMILHLVISVGVVGVVGIALVLFVLPKFAQKMADFTYAQSPQEYVPPTKLDEGRSLVLQGEFEQALEVFREFIEETEVQDRMAWVEMARIYLEEMEDADLAIETLEEGWEYEDANWEMGDDVDFMWRLAELYLDERGDKEAAIGMYETVLERYGENEYQAGRANAALAEVRG